MSRIAETFAAAHDEDRAVFIAYVTAGDPRVERTSELVLAMARAGADIIELGVPFSDPIADGPTNQRAAERALLHSTSLRDVLGIVREVREQSSVPIVLFTYCNPVLRYGIAQFAKEAAASEVDGVLFTDVPVEEFERFRPSLDEEGIDPILLVTPTSGKNRIKTTSRAGKGFLYLVARTGVTGARTQLDPELEQLVAEVRKISRMPVAVGFGIADPEQVHQVATWADGVVVGSAIVNEVAAAGDSDRLASNVEAFVRPLVEACRR